jgi:FdhD protein
MTEPRAPSVRASRQAVRDGVWSSGGRDVPEETAIALVVDGGAEAVMMATPADIEDFAYGFALTEGLARAVGDIRDLEIVHVDLGVEARLWLQDGARNDLAQRRRRKVGPVGCGLCGVESLEDAMRRVTSVTSDFTISADEIVKAMGELPALQHLNEQTRAVHAAALYSPSEGVVLLREDVGRHNALDKLIGALARQGRDASGGVILMTSRVSVELIQKAACAHAPVLAAISAPTALALRLAEEAGIAVCGVVRENGLEVFTHPARISRDAD